MQAARYVFHGYDMAETGSRVVCLCTSAELRLKLPEPSRLLWTNFAPVCMPGLLQAQNPRATGTHLTRSPSATAPYTRCMVQPSRLQLGGLRICRAGRAMQQVLRSTLLPTLAERLHCAWAAWHALSEVPAMRECADSMSTEPRRR